MAPEVDEVITEVRDLISNIMEIEYPDELLNLDPDDVAEWREGTKEVVEMIDNFLKRVDANQYKEIIDILKKIRDKLNEQIDLARQLEVLLEKINRSNEEIDDLLTSLDV